MQPHRPELDAVIITAELARRPTRAPDLGAENQALQALARQLTGPPAALLNRLAVSAQEACQADSAGVSVLTSLPTGEAIWRWEAIAGAWAGYVGGSTPAAFSPEGVCLARGAPQLYSYPARSFTYLDAASPPLVESLVIPWADAAGPLGTIWILAHDERHRFDAEDVRLLTSLASFAGAVLRALHLIDSQRDQVAVARQHEHQIEELKAVLRQARATSTARQQQAERRALRLAELDQLKDDLLAMVGHDLKSPLTSIKAWTQILQRMIGEPELDLAQLGRALHVIQTQTDRITNMLDDLLDAARIKAGAVELRLEPCDLNERLEHVLAHLQPADRRRVALHLPGEPLTGQWDGPKLERVLGNLLDNALKYSEGSQPVRVEVELHAQNLAVAIRDQGLGIPPGELPGLFERFHRTPQAQASGLPGTGLGLFICRGIVEAHGGRIWAESPGAGQGATVRFTLPRAARTMTPDEALVTTDQERSERDRT